MIDTHLGQALNKGEPLLWLNPAYQAQTQPVQTDLNLSDIHQADQRLRRFAPLTITAIS